MFTGLWSIAMNKDKEPEKNKPQSEFSRQVGLKETRKLQAQQESIQTVWSGLAMFGMIGWSVSVPTLLGIALGIWLDRHYPIGLSWTLIFLEIGLFLGCLNAWHWVAKEDRKIRKGHDKKDE